MNDEVIERPDFVDDEHLEYLDDLRDSGVTNMYCASSYLQRAFRINDKDKAIKILTYWMRTFSQRHPQ